MKRKSLKLKEADWFWLQEIAADTGSLYSRKPSWRRLVARIARGELAVSIAAPASQPSSTPLPQKQVAWSPGLGISFAGFYDPK